jgi:hypothetical protein
VQSLHSALSVPFERSPATDAAKSPAGGHPSLTHANPEEFHFPLNQHTIFAWDGTGKWVVIFDL